MFKLKIQECEETKIKNQKFKKSENYGFIVTNRSSFTRTVAVEVWKHFEKEKFVFNFQFI